MAEMGEIRSLQESDLASCGRIVEGTPLFQEYGLTASRTESILRKALSAPDSDLICVAENSGIQGFAWVMKTGAFGRSAYLRLIAVEPKAHGRGVGRKLLSELEKRYLQPNGLFLLVTETNSPARAFYKALGYEQVGMIPDYVKPGLNECVYLKR